MKTCPSCNRSYTDEALNFCLQDGSPLVNAPLTSETTAESRNPDPPATQIYHPNAPVPPPPGGQGGPYQQQYSPMPQYTPMAMAPQPRRSTAIWWILGALAVVVVLGFGGVIVLIAITSMSSESNNNNDRPVANSNAPNRNTNTNSITNNSNVNSATKLPAS